MVIVKNYLAWILAPFVAAAVGSIFTFSQIPTWYVSLIKPEFNPPDWLFGPAWTVLYLLMSISIYLILISKLKDKTAAKNIFVIQLIFNALWSIVFFGLHQIGLAVVVILILDIVVAANIYLFYKINKLAGLILVPYLAWILFATVLNIAIWQLN